MTLVETFADETEADFRAAMDALLQSISPERPNWWHPYEVRGAYEWRGVRFRHFFCVAGSVEAWIWKSAVDGARRRVVMLPSESCIMFAAPTLVGRGEEVTVSAEDFQAVRPAV